MRTLLQFIEKHISRGFTFFAPTEMRMFNSYIHKTLYNDKYIITSETSESHRATRWTVREIDWNTCSIHKMSKLFEFSNKVKAEGFIKELSKHDPYVRAESNISLFNKRDDHAYFMEVVRILVPNFKYPKIVKELIKQTTSFCVLLEMEHTGKSLTHRMESNRQKSRDAIIKIVIDLDGCIEINEDPRTDMVRIGLKTLNPHKPLISLPVPVLRHYTYERNE